MRYEELIVADDEDQLEEQNEVQGISSLNLTKMIYETNLGVKKRLTEEGKNGAGCEDDDEFLADYKAMSSRRRR